MKLNGFFVSFAFAIVGMAVASEPIKLGSSRFVTEAARAVGQQTGVAEEELHARAGFKDDLGQVHVRFDRYHRGVPVNGGDVVAHFDGAGRHISTDGVAPRLDLDVDPALPAATAVEAAKALIGSPARHTVRLEVYLDDFGQTATLVWHVSLEGVNDTGPFAHELFIDAQTGDLVHDYDNLQTAGVKIDRVGTGHSLYSGDVQLHSAFDRGLGTNKYELRDLTRGGMYCVDMLDRHLGAGRLFVGDDADWGDGTMVSRETVAADAQYGGAATWDYFLTAHGRKGAADDGVGSYNRVHYQHRPRDLYENAYWSDSCKCMTYGDGDIGDTDGDGIASGPLVSLDVAGHEMTHGVTSNTAGLVYYGESGGLNESTSDIFGTMVEFHANNSEDTPDYLIGEMVDFGINGEYLGFLRNMEDPRADGRSIDNYRDYHVGINVHYSSGIANNFYYLLANGGTNPSSGNTVPSGIGRVDAARIWYRALTVYMTSRTGFREARVACLRAAADLFGATSTQLRITDQAWNAVGVGAL